MTNVLTRFLKIFSDIAACVLVILMTVTLTDIIARHLHLFSVRGIVEISTFSVLMIGLFALPYSIVVGGQIVIDLATQRLPPYVRRLIDIFWNAIMTLALAYVSYRMWQATIDAYSSRDTSLDLQVPMIVFWIPASIGMSLTPIATLLAIRALLRQSQETKEALRPHH